MPTDRERWDAKYADRADVASDPADAFVCAALDGLRAGGVESGRAVDVASGRGRHALELARRGWETTAWDVSPVGLEQLSAFASNEELDVATTAVDLLTDGWPAAEPFELVVVVNFLDRPLYRRLAEIVRPGGHAIVTTFTQERPGTRPPLEFCLDPEELPHLFGPERVQLGFEDAGRAGVLLRF